MEIFTVLFGVAFLVESTVEYVIGTVFDKIPVLTPYKWTQMYIAGGVGVIGAFVYQFDLVSMLGTLAGSPVAVTSFGIILTGVGIGRGANYLHDVISTIGNK